MSLDCSELMKFNFKRKLKRNFCWFGHFTIDDKKRISFCSTSVHGKRILFSLTLSLIFHVLSSSNNNYFKFVNASEFSYSASLVENTDRSSSSSIGDIDGYVENIESNTGTGKITDTNFNSDTSQTRNLPQSIETNENTAKYEDNNNINEDTEKNPSEIQKAVCTITAGEVKASAEAVTTKTLKGVCTSAELQLAIDNLEMKLFKELKSLKEFLRQQIAFNQQSQNCDAKINVITSEESLLSTGPSPSLSTSPSPSIHFFKSKEMPEKKKISNTDQYSNVPNLKSLQTVKHVNPAPSRDKEVFKFNNTMLMDKDIKIFTYYWRLENFTSRIESGKSITIVSPPFVIKGKPLQLKAYFQHLHRDFLFIQLEYATLTKGNLPNRNDITNNIILDVGLLGAGGNLFKAISGNDQMLFKYKISILDQQNSRSPKDLISQEFHNLEAGFLIPNSALLGIPYVKEDTLLIQLFLYL